MNRRKRMPDSMDSNILSEHEMMPIKYSQVDEELIDEFDSEADMEILRIADKYSKKRDRTMLRYRILCGLTWLALLLVGAFLVLLVNPFFHPNLDSIRGSAHGSHSSPPSHEAFHLVRSKFLPTHQATFSFYQHIQTKAEFVSYEPLDKGSDKVFGISFRTKPTSSSGVAHILEHSVLSGSEKYPAKDPFLILLKGSLYTFLNAMTYNDRTV